MSALWQPTPDESGDPLAHLGLQENDFTDMMREGHVASRSVTNLDPRNASGTSRYIRMVGTLRGCLVRRGWVPGDPRGLATITSPDGQVTLVVCSGNALAGSVDLRKQPRTRYPKGPMYRAAVATNRQLVLGEPDTAPNGAPSSSQTWLALWWASALEGRVEISLPASVDKSGFVDGWAQRLILDPIALGEYPATDDDDPQDGIDVPVEPM